MSNSQDNLHSSSLIRGNNRKDYVKSNLLATHIGRVGGEDIQEEAVLSLYLLGCTEDTLVVCTGLLEKESIH